MSGLMHRAAKFAEPRLRLWEDPAPYLSLGLRIDAKAATIRDRLRHAACDGSARQPGEHKLGIDASAIRHAALLHASGQQIVSVCAAAIGGATATGAAGADCDPCAWPRIAAVSITSSAW